ncbi:MAG: hypothetical protein ACKV2T_21885 [Kofleriaceae bacterium]
MTAFWSRVVAALVRINPRATVAADHVRLVFVRRGEPAARIGVRVRLLGEALSIAADLGSIESTDTIQALRLATALVEGELVIDGDVLHVRSLVPIEDGAIADLDRTLNLVALQAAEMKFRLRRSHATAVHVASAMSHFSE